MSEPGVPIKELLRLCVALSDGSITEDDFARLDAVIASDAEARAFYLEFIRLSAALEQRADSAVGEAGPDEDLALMGLEAEGPDTSPYLLADAGRLLAPPSGPASMVDRTEEVEARRSQKKARERVRRAKLAATQASQPVVIPKAVVWLGIAAALLLCAVLIVANTGGPTSDPAPIVEQDPSTQPPVMPSPVATLVDSDRAVWLGSGDPLVVGARVAPGSIKLLSGTARFVLDGGAELMVKGPATIDLASAGSMKLDAGSVVAHVPPEAHGFEILGDGFQVMDLGAEFAVRVSPGSVQCRVILGEVRLAVTGPDALGETVHRLRANRLVEVDRSDGSVRALDYRQADDIAWALPYTALLNQELVVNGGFEDGAFGDAHTATEVDDVVIPGWVDDGPATVLDYQQAGVEVSVGFPDPRSDPMPEGRGRGYYFARHPGTTTQTIDLSGLAILTDAGVAGFVFAGDLGGYVGQDDRVLVSVTFFDASGRVLSRAELEPVDAAAREDQTGFVHRTQSGGLPVGARSARIEITAVRDVGGFTDGFADNISLVIESLTPETVSHMTPESAASGHAATSPLSMFLALFRGGVFDATATTLLGPSCDALLVSFSNGME